MIHTFYTLALLSKMIGKMDEASLFHAIYISIIGIGNILKDRLVQ